MSDRKSMKCHVCGGFVHPNKTDIPFKLGERMIVILKDLPVLQCERCREYILEDSVMRRVEEILSMVNQDSELQVVRFAA